MPDILNGQPDAPSGAGETDSGLICLALAAQHHGRSVTLADLRRRCGLGDGPLGPEDIARAARMSGFRAAWRRLDWDGLMALPGGFPLLVRLRSGDSVLVLGLARRADGVRVGVFDPRAVPLGAMEISRDSFTEAWTGEALFLKPRYRLIDPDQPFGLGWFVPELLRQGTAFRDVAVAALVLHGLALIMPVYFQIVIDKVLVHQTVNTLTVLTAGVLGGLGFEAVFRFLRQYLLLAAANRIDVRLLNRTFAHLLRLPIAFFDQRPAGVTIRHMQQVERIREFLTGQLLATLLDAAVLVVVVPILLSYSAGLTVIVLGFAGLTAALVLALAPAYRRRLHALYAADAERQAMMVETIHGMHTVKSSAMEPLREREWDRRAAETVTMHFRVGRISLLARAVIEFFEKAMMVAVIAAGAFAVFAGELSVGALIAFQMLAGRVSAPMTQIVGLVNQYQEILLSVRMLGEVMNHPAEQHRAGGVAPVLTGGIVLERVGFRYHPDRPPALSEVSLTIPPGTVIGVVGKSGSGKSTLVRLLQGFYPVGEGRILFDAAAGGGLSLPAVDAREIDIEHLRRSIGVVLQDNFLFRGSIRDNIAMTRPEAPMEAVLRAARMAGADEFIAALPQGYETLIDEGASNLSGGQKQRIAIARALLNQPRLLIFDEATSALDPDSEAVVMDNLAQIVRGRTVIMVTHRLSTLTGCHTIAVLDRGRLVDNAPHGTLLERCAIYRDLWRKQNRGL